MISPNVPNKLPSAYVSYRITVAVVGCLVLFLVIAGFLKIGSAISSAPGAMQTETINGIRQQVPVTPFAAGPFIAMAAVVLVILAILGILYQILYYNRFSFTVADGKITVTSGVL